MFKQNTKKGEAIPTLLLIIALLIIFLFLGLYLTRFVPWADDPGEVGFFGIFNGGSGSGGSGDSNDEQNSLDSNDGSGEVIGNASFLTIEQGVYSGVSSNGALIISNENDWRDLWRQIHSNDHSPVPDIDFDKVFVVAVFQGFQSTGGYSISIDGISMLDDFWRVHVTSVEPGSSCNVTQADTQPYHVVAVEHSGQDIKFISETQTTDCN